MKKINVGIVGCGVIGGVLNKWLKEHNNNVNVFISDPPKGFNDNLEKVDIIFINIHIPTTDNRSQDLTTLLDIIKKSPNVPIFIRTTLIPGTCDKISKQTNKKICFMPEFLTERTAYDDFCKQPMIFTSEIDLLKKIFLNKQYITMTNLEAEITKYAHNVFGALKVTYFNGIYELSQQHNCNYENIRKGVLLSGYINENHTLVPGPDGKLGYGGKCFPKDVSAFINFCSTTKIKELLKDIESINNIYRE